MKIRSNYVSNSSSSSFIVFKDLSDRGISCLKLSQEQKELINGFQPYDDDEKINLDLHEDAYLTQFISDCYDKYDTVKNEKHIFYQEGQLCEEPRIDGLYNEYTGNGYGKPVYLLKKHDKAKQMTLSKFVKEHKNSELPQEFIVKYEDDGIKLIYVW